MKALTPPVTRRRWGTQLAAGGVAAVLLACDQLPGGGGRSGASKGCTQPMELLVPWPDTDPVHAGLKKTIDDFVAVHPQCPIQPSVVSPWSAERLTTSIAAGSPPPLTALMPNTVSNWGPMGLLEPLDELFKGAKLTAADFFPPVWETMSWQDRVWHVPLQVDPNFPLFWNKAMLREAGLNPDTPPTTIDELDLAAQALNREVGGRWERIAFAPWLWYGLSNALTTTAYMFGGSFYDKDKDQVTFNHPQVVKAVEWMAGWSQRLGQERVAELLGGGSAAAVVAKGKLAFQPLVSVDLPSLKKVNPSVELGAGLLPAAAPGQPGAVWTGGWHAGAVPGSRRWEDAWEFLRWIGTSPDGTLSVAKQMGGLPGYVKSPGLELLAKDPNTAAHVEAIKRSQFLPPTFYAPVSIDFGPLNEALAGKRPVAATLDELNEQTQLKLKGLRARQSQQSQQKK